MKITFIFVAAMCIATLSFAQEKIAPAKPGVTYGKPTTAANAINVTTLNTELKKDTLYTGKVKGQVVEVCKKKGCFMKISQTNGDPIMVRFTDYAYFMPQDIVGKTVVLDGEAKVKETSVERLKHFAADAGKSKEEIAKINQPKKEIEIMADGVLVVE